MKSMVCIHTVAVENFPIPFTVYYQAMQKQEKGFVVLLENTTKNCRSRLKPEKKKHRKYMTV